MHMKKLTLVIILLFSIATVNAAIQECKSPIDPSDIPCSVVSTYNFGSACGEFRLKIYNQTPVLLDERNWTAYTGTDRCNITFNYSKRGSYTLNSTDGSSATIIVEGEKVEIINLTIFITFLFFGFLSIAFMHMFKHDEGSSIVYGFVAGTLLCFLGLMTLFGFAPLAVETTLPFDINTSIGLLMIVFGIYGYWYSTTLIKVRKHTREEEERDMDFKAY